MSDQELSLDECPQALLDVERLAQAGEFAKALALGVQVQALYSKASQKKEAAEASSLLAGLYEKLGKPDFAREAYRSAYSNNPANQKILAGYGNFLYHQRDVAEAAKIFRSLLLIPQGSNPAIAKPEIYLRLGNLSLLESPSNTNRAMDMFKRGLEFDPESAQLQEALKRAARGEAPLIERPNVAPAPTPKTNLALQHFSQEETMKQSRICPKCKHNRVLFIGQVSDQTSATQADYKILGDAAPEPVRQISSPWRIARTPLEPEPGFFGSPVAVASAGLVEAYVCRSCGFTELYTKDPSQIPIDGKYVQELVGPDKKEDPYR